LVNENLTKKRLKKIEDNIQAMDLLETFSAMSDLEECMSCLEELLAKETIEKKEKIFGALEKELEKIE
jgi:hypothetical protein